MNFSGCGLSFQNGCCFGFFFLVFYYKEELCCCSCDPIIVLYFKNWLWFKIIFNDLNDLRNNALTENRFSSPGCIEKWHVLLHFMAKPKESLRGEKIIHGITTNFSLSRNVFYFLISANYILHMLLILWISIKLDNAGEFR